MESNNPPPVGWQAAAGQAEARGHAAAAMNELMTVELEAMSGPSPQLIRQTVVEKHTTLANFLVS